MSSCAQKTYADLPIFLLRDASSPLTQIRMPPFLFLDIPRYVIRIENLTPHRMRITRNESETG